MVPVTSSTSPRWPLLVGPALLVFGAVLLFVSNELKAIGPFDRATFGWAFCVPLLALAPVATGLAGRWSGPSDARRLTIVVAVGCGVFLLAVSLATTHQIGCEPVSDPARIAVHVAPIAIAGALAWLAPSLVALANRDRPVVAVTAGLAAAVVGGGLILLSLALVSAGVSCAYVPSPG